MKRIWPAIRAVGPSIPSGYLDGRIEDDRDYGLSLFDLNGDVSAKWLDGRRKGSVVYVSFGSFGKIAAEQVEEMAACLKRSNWDFLWVVMPKLLFYLFLIFFRIIIFKVLIVISNII